MNEDSLYFHHFLKVVYSRACENRRMWIKARKLKDENILKKAFYKSRIKVSIFTIYINTKGGMVMFIGQIGQIRTPTHMGNRGILAVQANSPFTPRQASQPQHDRVEIGTQNQQVNETGIYRPDRSQMRAFAPISYTKVAPDERLQKEMLPPPEQGAYTEDDALINQYMKQYRIEGYFDGDTFVRSSSEPVKLILKDEIPKEDLENFRNELIANGLGTEIDWHGVENDLGAMDVNFDNINHFEQKADYLASRYAVLKDRIQTQFTGDKQEAELQKLDQIYTQAKEKMADSYAERIGGFYEDLGQSGAADEMRNSVLAVIDGKADSYTAHLAQNDVYADITDPNKQWLKQDDAYMAAQLRESVSAVSTQKSPTVNEQAPYSEKDLAYAGVFAKELSQQLKQPEWDTFTIKSDDSDLGKHLAEQYKSLMGKIENAGISNEMSNILKDSFEPFIEKFIDALDAKIDQNRDRVTERPWQADLIRTNYIDRESVYAAFHNAIS